MFPFLEGATEEGATVRTELTSEALTSFHVQLHVLDQPDLYFEANSERQLTCVEPV